MGIKKFKAITPSLRYRTVSDFSDITKNVPEKSLLDMVKRSGGRNNKGRITMRRRGGGHKRRYRVIDFKRKKLSVPSKVAAIEYDPNRSARIALLHYADGEKRYILAPHELKVGDHVLSGPDAEIRSGNALPLAKIPLGTVLHAIEMKPGKGAQLVRSAGTGAQLMAREGSYATLRLPSGEMRMIHVRCLATVGQVGNLEHENQTFGKAGRARWLGRRDRKSVV